MDNLAAALSGKTLEQLETTDNSGVSNPIEPTKAEIETILTALANGQSHKEIKKTVRRVVMDGETQLSAQGFSLAQIQEIDQARLAKISELTPKQVEP